MDQLPWTVRTGQGTRKVWVEEEGWYLDATLDGFTHSLRDVRSEQMRLQGRSLQGKQMWKKGTTLYYDVLL